MLLSITMRCGTVTAANHASSLGLGNHSLTGAFTTNVGLTSRVTVVSGPPNTIDRVTTMLCNTRRSTSNPKKESPPSGRARQLLSCDGVLDGAAGAHESKHPANNTGALELLAGVSLHELHQAGQAKRPVQDLTEGEPRAGYHHVPVSVRVKRAHAAVTVRHFNSRGELVVESAHLVPHGDSSEAVRHPREILRNAGQTLDCFRCFLVRHDDPFSVVVGERLAVTKGASTLGAISTVRPPRQQRL